MPTEVKDTHVGCVMRSLLSGKVYIHLSFEQLMELRKKSLVDGPWPRKRGDGVVHCVRLKLDGTVETAFLHKPVMVKVVTQDVFGAVTKTQGISGAQVLHFVSHGQWIDEPLALHAYLPIDYTEARETKLPAQPKKKPARSTAAEIDARWFFWQRHGREALDQRQLDRTRRLCEERWPKPKSCRMKSDRRKEVARVNFMSRFDETMSNARAMAEGLRERVKTGPEKGAPQLVLDQMAELANAIEQQLRLWEGRERCAVLAAKEQRNSPLDV